MEADASQPDATSDQVRPYSRTRTAVGTGIAVAIMVVLVARLIAGWDEIEPHLSDVRVGPLLGAFALFVLGETLIAIAWLSNLRSLGAMPRRTAGIATVFVSNLGRLVPLPGAPQLARVGLASHAGATTDVAAASVLMEGLLGILAAVTVGAAALLDDAVVATVPGGRWWLVVWVVVAFVVVLGLANRLFDGVLGRFGKGPLPRMSPASAVAAFALYLAAWSSFGLALSAILAAFDLPSPGLLAAAGMFALSWFVGFVVVIVPGGLGVREGALAAMLAPSIGAEAAILVTLVARLIWWLGLGVLAAGGVGVLGTSILRPRRESPEPGTIEQEAG